MRIMIVMELDVELDNTLMIPFQPASKSTARVKTRKDGMTSSIVKFVR